MRHRFLFVILAVIGLACDKSAPELLIPCDCKSYPTIGNQYNIKKGIIIYPNRFDRPYMIYVPEDDNGLVAPLFSICTDSVSIAQIKKNKISDSTWVFFKGGIIDKKLNCGGVGSVRIVSMEKL